MSKTIVITGSSDGIGAAAARQLVKDGHEVVVVGRSPEKTKAVAQELKSDFFVADFASFDQVRGLAEALDAKYPVIDVLANNAGGIFGDRDKTVDGFEKTLQVNHLSPFLLTNLLLQNLIGAKATVIQTSSAGARLFGKVDLDDLGNEKKFSPAKAYGDAKLENILFTKELHARFHDQGISAAAFHPGAIATSFATDSPSAMRFVYKSSFARRFLGGVEKGADQLVWLATARPGTDWTPGEYYEKRKPAKTNPQASDARLARGLWDRSAQLVGLTEA